MLWLFKGLAQTATERRGPDIRSWVNPTLGIGCDRKSRNRELSRRSTNSELKVGVTEVLSKQK